MDLMQFRWNALRYGGEGLRGVAVTGVLKGFDQLVNVVLDDAVEYLRGVS